MNFAAYIANSPAGNEQTVNSLWKVSEVLYYEADR